MAEQSLFWTTNNTGDGPSSGYSVTRWAEFLRDILNGGNSANGGVLQDVDNELSVSGAASPLAVASGAAIVNGFYYKNSASLNLAVTTPVVGTTGGHIVLRADYAAQTVRAVAVRNTDGLSAIPALTQVNGTTWEIRLASFTITTGGVITVTDARNYAKYSTELDAVRLTDGTITAAKLGTSAVTNTKIQSNAVTTAKITDANVTTAKIADDAVDYTKAGTGVAQLNKRQGGSATNWSTAGTTGYDTGAVKEQVGTAQCGVSVSSNVVTFPVAFSQPPVVVLNVRDSSGGASFAQLLSVSTTGFTYVVYVFASLSPASIQFSASAKDVMWRAVGPE